jgi:hypothetical protein
MCQTASLILLARVLINAFSKLRHPEDYRSVDLTALTCGPEYWTDSSHAES